uniref:Putative LOV domain-containing protein n=1 Tax=Tetraselmis chuii TaxID=63592 RepID=A0A126WYE2_9CHLO|nr:putative LOV domain-containing protein [Tetraselmis chuii]
MAGRGDAVTAGGSVVPSRNNAPRETLPPHVCGGDHRTRGRIDQLLRDNLCGLVVVDALEADHPIIYVDTEFQRQSGYHATEILGRNCRFLQYRGPYATEPHPEIDEAALAHIRVAISQGQECEVELLNFGKDGRPLWNKLHMLPIFGDQQRSPSLVTHYAGLVRFTPLARHHHLAPMQTRQRPWTPPPPPAPTRTPHRPWPAADMPDSARPFFPAAQVDHNGPNVFMLSSELLLKLMSLLDPWSLAKLSMVDSRFHELCRSNSVWRMAAANQWGRQAAEVLDSAGWRLGWANIAREIVTFEALHWRRFKVGGTVNPRANFSACAVGNRMLIFGGEGLNGQPLNDAYILDLSAAQPAWEVLEVREKPQGRWGHTLRWLRDSWVVLFGGFGAQGSLNDLYLLDIGARVKVWHKVSVARPPAARSWHSSCTLHGSQMVVFGGKGERGNLLNDTVVLDLRDTAAPCWRELDMAWQPPGVLGHSLCTTTGSKVFMFGGLQASGAVRLRTNDVFLLDLAAGAPCWQYISGSTLPSGSNVAGQAPSPRLEAVSGQLLGGHIVVFGGSTTANDATCHDVYTLNPDEAQPRWRKLAVLGIAPERGWGFSACTVGGSKILLPIGDSSTGQLLLNEFSELSLVSSGEASIMTRVQGKPEHRVAKYPSMMSANYEAKDGAAAAAELPERIRQHLAHALQHLATSSDRSTEIEDSALPAGQGPSVQGVERRHSGCGNSSSGDDTVTSPLVGGEGSNSGGGGEGHTAAVDPSAAADLGDDALLDDNASTSTRKRGHRQPRAESADDPFQKALRVANGVEAGGGAPDYGGGSSEGSGRASSSLDSTPSGHPDDKCSNGDEENQRRGGTQQRCRGAQVGPSLTGDE